MDKRFEPLDTGEVLSIDETARFLIGHRTFRAGEFAEAIRTQLENGVNGWTSEKDGWFSKEGIPCEVLRFTANGWQKGKVRISLEFCPQDTEEEQENVSASIDNQVASGAATSTEDDLYLVDFASSSEDVEESPEVEEVIALGAVTTTEFDLELVDSPFDSSDELELETPALSNWEQEPEDPSSIYIEMEQQAPTFIPDEEFSIAQTPSSLDDEFDLGEISESIEQELELVQAPTASDNELLDLGDMSSQDEDNLDFGNLSVQDDDDLDFGALSAEGEDEFDLGAMPGDSEDEFQFDDISLDNESEGHDTDSLLDDVWQDMNEASWQNKQQ